jgi:hypothetical protein
MNVRTVERPPPCRRGRPRLLRFAGEYRGVDGGHALRLTTCAELSDTE